MTLKSIKIHMKYGVDTKHGRHIGAYLCIGLEQNGRRVPVYS